MAVSVRSNSYTLATVPFNSASKGQAALIEDLPTLAYNDGFQWRSAADNSILATNNSAFLQSGSYRDYFDVPLFAGDTAQLKALFNEAATSFKDVLIFGDSQETTPGGGGATFVPALNLESFKRHGAPSKTPWYAIESFPSDSTFCFGGSAAEVGNTAETIADPPGVRLKITNGLFYGPLACLYPDGGANTLLTSFGGVYFPADTGTLNYEFVAVTDSGGPAEIRVQQKTNTADRNYFGTLEQNIIYDATDMSASDGTHVKISVGPLIYNASRPFINIYTQGWDGVAVQTGHQYRVSRFSDSGRNKGVSFTSWSQGGQSVANLLLKTDIGSAVQAAGPWDVIVVTLGTNTGGSGTIAAQKTRYQNLLTQIRTWAGNANQFVLFVSEPPRESFNSQLELDLYLAQAAQMGEIVQENDNVSFLNLGARLLAKYPTFGVSQSNGGTFLADGVHLTSSASAIAAQEFWAAIEALP